MLSWRACSANSALSRSREPAGSCSIASPIGPRSRGVDRAGAVADLADLPADLLGKHRRSGLTSPGTSTNVPRAMSPRAIRRSSVDLPKPLSAQMKQDGAVIAFIFQA